MTLDVENPASTLEHLSGHISPRFARLLDAPGTRIVSSQAWHVGEVRLWVDGVHSADGGLTPLLTVQAYANRPNWGDLPTAERALTLGADDARKFVHAACEVRAAMVRLGDLRATMLKRRR
jgi:hypothetical protein